MSTSWRYRWKHGIVSAMIDMSVSTRERIIQAATDLLTSGGREAVSTRAVSAAAGVQPPTIYRQFGDMRGLLDTVASRGVARYIEQKLAQAHSGDPVEDLRQGWDLHVAFGLANPAIYALMYGEPRPDAAPSAVRETSDILHGQMQRVAEAGRLRVSVEHAAAMSHAAGVGVTLSLLAQPPAERDPNLSVATREAVLAAVTTDDSGPSAPVADPSARVASRAIALKAVLAEGPADLTAAERAMISEWLDRLIRAAS